MSGPLFCSQCATIAPDGSYLVRVRVDLGENPANAIWLWGQSADAKLPSFTTLLGMKGVAVAGAPLAKGLAKKAGFELADVRGASGDLETDLTAKAAAAEAAVVPS